MSWAADRPSLDAPTPVRGRRASRIEAAFSSTASARTALSETPRRRASARSVASVSSSAVTVVLRIVMHDANTSRLRGATAPSRPLNELLEMVGRRRRLEGPPLGKPDALEAKVGPLEDVLEVAVVVKDA